MKRLVIILSFATLLASCSHKNNDNRNIDAGALFSPIQLDIDTTPVWLTDYIPDYKKIDSISLPPAMDYLRVDSSVIAVFVKPSGKIRQMEVLKLYSGGHSYDVPLRKSEKKKVTLSYRTLRKTQQVKLKGEMNSWNADATILTKKNGVWSVDLWLEPGTYQYLFVVDGKEILDPANPDSVSNGMGGYNSLLKVGQSSQNKPYLYTKSYDSKKIIIGFERQPEQFQVFYQNSLLSPDLYLVEDSVIVIEIPKQAKKQKLSYLRVYAANEAGFSNDILIPLQNGKVVNNTSKLPRDDFHSAVIYNIMVDRFYNGDTTNDPQPLDSVLPPAQYHGGDLEGIAQKFEDGYFDSLGINTLWISPIVKNVQGAWGLWKNPYTRFSAYHGYWPVSLTQIDSRLGDSASLVNLTGMLHKSDKNILLDFVGHHVHKSYWLYKQHPEYFTSLYLPDGRLNTELWDEERLTTWFDVFLPTFNTALPRIYNMVADSAVWWIKTYDLDGFRHDAAKHVHLELWRALTRKLKLEVEIPQHRKVYQIGETYGSPELIGSYVSCGILDGQFDFNVYDKLKWTLAGGSSFEELKNELDRSFKYYGCHNLMGYITGNQDQGRIISYLSGQIPLDVWGNALKQIGWTNPPGPVTDTSAFKKARLLFAFINTIPGIPVIYYGDEIGMPGAGDPDNRRDMQFDNLSQLQLELKNTVSQLVTMRRSSMPLVYGDFKWIYVDNDLMIYERNYFGKKVFVAINKSSKPASKTLILDVNNLNLVLGSNGKVQKTAKGTFNVMVPAEGFLILKNY